MTRINAPVKNSAESVDKIYGYIVLDMAAEITKRNYISEYWRTNNFYGQPDFGNVMSRDTFMKRRELLQFYPQYNHNQAVIDPLWHSQTMCEYVLKNCASDAVIIGVRALNEDNIKCKARTSDRPYMYNKPVTFDISY